MAAITTGDVHGAVDHEDHAGDGTYWKIFGFLFVLTALEVSTDWWPESMSKVTNTLLIIMMVIKFAIVALYFMHLKNDAKLLRQVFMFGIILAVAVYAGALGSLRFLTDSGNVVYNDPPRVRSDPPPPTDPPPIIREIVGGHG